jgi:hypothetical protein
MRCSSRYKTRGTFGADAAGSKCRLFRTRDHPFVHFTCEAHFKMKSGEKRQMARMRGVSPPCIVPRTDQLLRWPWATEEKVTTRRITTAMIVVLMFGLATGRVLLFGYAVGAASMLMIAGLLVKPAMRRGIDPHAGLLPARALDLADREAA